MTFPCKTAATNSSNVQVSRRYHCSARQIRYRQSTGQPGGSLALPFLPNSRLDHDLPFSPTTGKHRGICRSASGGRGLRHPCTPNCGVWRLSS
ncbi:hypothetical protein J3E69DRAFT_328276 [Trichoderma sp. SZMC 28015]